MARKSRKNRNVESNIQTVVKKENLLDTAAYIRLSVENGGNETDETLVVQQMLVERFIEEHPDLRLEEVYIDNGFTGTNFERPGFMRLMEDVRSGKVQCIVVKDLSRFGRDYLETGYYLETILPKLNVRFIAITDDYDSSRKEDRENISVPIKNMVNAMYAKDMSKKILAAKEAQKRNGNITLSKVAFGYVRSEDKTRQVVDETVAPVVRMIFQWTLLGVSKREIADRLNLLGIATPGQKEKRKIYRIFSNKVIGESALIWKGGVQMPKTTANITGVSLCQKKGIIRIFRSTIKELGDPRYIRFLFNPEKRTLAVQSVSRKEAECFRVPKYNPKDWDFKICSIQMLRIIWRVCEWNENDTYRIAGTHYPEYNLVEFNLNQARIVQFGEIE